RRSSRRTSGSSIATRSDSQAFGTTYPLRRLLVSLAATKPPRYVTGAACELVEKQSGPCRALGTPPAHLGVDVERHHRAMLLVVAPRGARDAPHDLELVAVGVGAVERLRNA